MENLNFSNLNNIKMIDKNEITLKNDIKINTGSYSFLDTIKSQRDLEDFDYKVNYIFRNIK